MIYDLQKASMWKRAIALLLDLIVLAILITGLAAGISAIVRYDSYLSKMNGYYEEYSERFGVDFKISLEKYNELSPEEQARYDEAYAALNADDGAVRTYTMMLSLTVLISSFSILIAVLVLEFVVPLMMGNGQTIGKKIFGIGLMRTDGVRVSTPQLLIRSLLGKYTIEIMVPVLIAEMILFNTMGIVGPIILGLLLVLQVVLIIATRTNSPIHDVLAKTVAVDLASQMIFDSEEALIAYKEKVALERAQRDPYF